MKAGSRTITCNYVVLATHTPLMGKTSVVSASLLQTKLALYTSYAIGGTAAAGALPEAAFWDTADPYHYLRVDRHRGFDYVILGGEDHKTGQAADTAACFQALEETLKSLVPDVEVTHRWSGQVIETNDGLPYIGETSPRQFAATGFSGNGMTFGTIAAMMARDAALGRSNPWRELFDVHRTTLGGGTWNYLKENKDYLYYLVRDRFAASEKSLRAVPRGEGRLVDLNGEQVAAYRNEQGVVTPGLQSARTWDAWSHGTMQERPGIARVTAPGSNRTATSWRVPRNLRWPRPPRKRPRPAPGDAGPHPDRRPRVSQIKIRPRISRQPPFGAVSGLDARSVV